MSRFTPDYNTIKKFAKKLKRSIKDLIVLAPQNDPYYVGTKTELRYARWIARYVAEYLKERDRTIVHDRAIHYWLLSKNIDRPIGKRDWKVYNGDESDFNFTMKSIQNARLLGLIPFPVISDMKNPEPLIMANYCKHLDLDSFTFGPEELAKSFVHRLQPFNPQLQQAYHVEIWTEKTTIDDILRPIANKYGVNIQTFSGQATLTRVYELVERIIDIDKPVRVLYIADFDKYGHNMPVACGRKLQWIIDHCTDGQDVKLDKILLTEEQVEEYGLPSAPGEEFKVELDALEVYHPGETGRIVEEAVSRYIDLGVTAEINLINKQFRRDAYNALIEALEPIRDQLESKRFNDYLPDEIPSVELIDEDTESLYDSSRDYVDQTKVFKRFLASRS